MSYRTGTPIATHALTYDGCGLIAKATLMTHDGRGLIAKAQPDVGRTASASPHNHDTAVTSSPAAMLRTRMPSGAGAAWAVPGPAPVLDVLTTVGGMRV